MSLSSPLVQVQSGGSGWGAAELTRAFAAPETGQRGGRVHPLWCCRFAWIGYERVDGGRAWHLQTTSWELEGLCRALGFGAGAGLFVFVPDGGGAVSSGVVFGGSRVEMRVNGVG